MNPDDRASVVLKWPLLINDDVQEIGGGGEVVLVAIQGPTLCVWTREHEGDGGSRRVRVVGTGHLLHQVGPHLGSVIDGSFVWHVFEVTP